MISIYTGNSFLMPVFIKSAENNNTFEIPSSYINQLPEDNYILGPGDLITVNVSEDYPELLSQERIDGEGTIYLPKLKRLYIEGLTINELNKILNDAYKKYIKYPAVEVSISEYRVVRIGVRGEVNDPGLHTLQGAYSLSADLDRESNTFYFPTLFDAIRESGGITEYSDLSNIEVIRKENLSKGGGEKKAVINFNSTFLSNDISKNIRIYDSDIITIKKLENGQMANLRKAISTNLNPRIISVIVSGRVNNPGPIKLPKSSVLSDALALAEIKIIRGKVTFIRFNNDGSIDKRKLNFSERIKRGSFKNPVLKNNDLVFVGNSLLGMTNEVLTEITQPFVGIFSTYGLIQALTD